MDEDKREVCDGCWKRGWCSNRTRVAGLDVPECKCPCVRAGWHHTDYLMRQKALA